MSGTSTNVPAAEKLQELTDPFQTDEFLSADINDLKQNYYQLKYLIFDGKNNYITAAKTGLSILTNVAVQAVVEQGEAATDFSKVLAKTHHSGGSLTAASAFNVVNQPFVRDNFPVLYAKEIEPIEKHVRNIPHVMDRLIYASFHNGQKPDEIPEVPPRFVLGANVSRMLSERAVETRRSIGNFRTLGNMAIRFGDMISQNDCELVVWDAYNSQSERAVAEVYKCLDMLREENPEGIRLTAQEVSAEISSDNWLNERL
jgi:hypothetical protein